MSDAEGKLFLSQMNLIVIPVTRRLLAERSRAKSFDIEFAVENGIPVLPIICERGIVRLYSSDSRLAAIQYIDRAANGGH